MAGVDPLAKQRPSAMSGCRSGLAAAQSDTADLPYFAKAIRVAVAGNVKFIPVGNADADTLTVALAAGEVFDMFQIRRIFTTGTTATGIIVGWD